MRNKIVNPTFLFILALLALWQFLVWSQIWPSYVVPSPASVWREFCFLFLHEEGLKSIFHTFRRLLLGFGVAVVLGAGLGVFFYLYPRFYRGCGPIAVGIQTLPSLCWVPLAMLWFGPNDQAIFWVVVFGTVFGFSNSFRTALEQVPLLYLRVGRTLGARGLQFYRRILIPAAIPQLLEALRQAWSFSWRSLMGAELMFVTPGLGHLLNTGRELNNVGQVVAVMLVIVVFGFFGEKVFFGPADRWVRVRWGERDEKEK